MYISFGTVCDIGSFIRTLFQLHRCENYILSLLSNQCMLDTSHVVLKKWVICSTLCQFDSCKILFNSYCTQLHHGPSNMHSQPSLTCIGSEIVAFKATCHLLSNILCASLHMKSSISLPKTRMRQICFLSYLWKNAKNVQSSPRVKYERFATLKMLVNKTQYVQLQQITIERPI